MPLPQQRDNSYGTAFNGPLVLSKLSKELQGTASKEFKSKFARKAMADLASYEELQAKREAALEEMYSRPYDNIVIEESGGRGSESCRRADIGRCSYGRASGLIL